MILKSAFFLLFFLILFSFPLLSLGDNSKNSLEISVGTEWMYGYTLYKIGGFLTDPSGQSWPLPFPVSELQFPADLLLLTADADWHISEYFRLTVSLKGSITTNNGFVEDSDWGSYYLKGFSWASPTTLDTYSTSQSSLAFYSADATLAYKVRSWGDLRLYAGLGFLFQYFYYGVSDLNQTYPSSWLYAGDTGVDSGTVYIAGQVGTYTLYQYLPYGLLNLNFITDYLKLDVTAGISPSFSYDMDNHILRYKEQDGSAFGYSLIGRIKLSYYFYKNFFLDLRANILYTSTSGSQYQYFYAYSPDDNAGPGPIGTIGYSQESLLFTGGAGIGLAF
jgi:hypothetical protein